MQISFSPPDIGEYEIAEVVDTLRSGWITTGPKTKLFEKKIAEFCHTDKAVCLNSATAALELTLRVLGIGEGDEVITSAYTYTASASVIQHVGAKIVLIDTAPNSYEMDYDKLEQAITEKTKAIIPVDLAGVICDYDRLYAIVKKQAVLFRPRSKIQEAFGRIVLLADAAHAFGATRHGKMCGEIADITCFSFHAVKNFTTAEGGAVTWLNIAGISNEDLYKEFMLLSLHGQSKDALAKMQLGAWEYDIVYPAYKCNMTDIMASIGLAQLKRYPDILKRRQQIIGMYDQAFKNEKLHILKHYGDGFASSGHLYMVRFIGRDMEYRNAFIKKLAEEGISSNVHYKPLPMHTAYKALGFDIKNYPRAYEMFANEITLPLHTLLTDEEIEYIIKTFTQLYGF
jgi:dTDP-4-amino-4,6-dideoxygalactose transaminase